MKTHLLVLLLITGCMSSSTTVEPPSAPTAGSSSADADSGTNGSIFGLHDSGTWEDTDGGLVMAPEDAGPDAQEPLDAGVDAATDAELPMPDAGHDAAAPVLGKTCDTCATNADCEAGYTCQYVVGDGASACFLRANSLPTGTYCGDLEPAGHLATGCYGPCNANPVVCRADPTCAAWKAEYAGVSAY